MNTNKQELQGLSVNEVADFKAKFGTNTYTYKKENRLFAFLKSIFAEPMILLLLVASGIYFINQQYSDGVFLCIFNFLNCGNITLSGKEKPKCIGKITGIYTAFVRGYS